MFVRESIAAVRSDSRFWSLIDVARESAFVRLVYLRAVIGCFLRDGDVMWMVLPHGRGRHFDKSSNGAKLGDGFGTTVPHSSAEPADELVNVIGQWAFERYSAFDPFWNQFRELVLGALSVPFA